MRKRKPSNDQVFTPETAFNECPICKRSQCHEHSFKLKRGCCGKLDVLSAFTIAQRRFSHLCASCRVKGDRNPVFGLRYDRPDSKGIELSEEHRGAIGDGLRKAYAEGRRKPPKTKASTYYLHYPNGKEFWVQGSFEFAYAQHLLDSRIEFEAHPQKLQYVGPQGNLRSYFPDFYLVKEDRYVDVKSEWTASDKAFWAKKEAVEKHNGVEIEVVICTS